MPTLVKVTVDDEDIARIFMPGGDAWNWMERVGREQMEYTLAGTPVRTGELRKSMNLALTPNGKNNVRYSVGSYSEHAEYVIFGTTPPIYGDGNFMSKPRRLPNGRMSVSVPLLWIRPAPHSWFAFPFQIRFVDGQMANDFMGRAGTIIYSKYG